MSDEVKQTRIVRRAANGHLLPGSTANPNGRPKRGLALSDVIRDKLYQKPDGESATNLEAILSKTIIQAREGDAQARQWLSDHGFGKAPETIMIGRMEQVELSWNDNQLEEADEDTSILEDAAPFAEVSVSGPEPVQGSNSG
jgi:hypothetical protein